MVKFHGIVKNNKGQFAIEAVLLISVLIGVFVSATTVFRQRGTFQKVFDIPVVRLKNMAAYGTFKEECKGLGSRASQQRLSNCHPNSITRALSSDPN